MTGLITALVAAATALSGIGIVTAKGDIFKSAPWWVAPVLFIIAGLFYVLALALGTIHWKRERKKELVPPPATSPPPVQESKQSVSQNFNPQFNPQQNFYIGTDGPKSVTSEPDETEIAIVNWMRRIRPAGYHEAKETAKALNLTPQQIWKVFLKLEKEGRVHRTQLDQAFCGAAFVLDELERELTQEQARKELDLPSSRPKIIPVKWGASIDSP